MSDNEHQDDNPSPVDSEENLSENEEKDLPQRELKCLCSYIFFVDEADLQEEERFVDQEERKKMLVNYCQHLMKSTVELPAECSRREFPLCAQCETKIERFRKLQRENFRRMKTNATISKRVRHFFHNTKEPYLLAARRGFIRSDVRELSSTFHAITEVYQRILGQEIPSGSRITSPTSQQAREPMDEEELDPNRLDHGEGDGESKREN